MICDRQSKSSDSIPAYVPGDVHEDLRKAGLIPEPLLLENTKYLDYLEYMEFWYYRSFTLNPEQCSAKNMDMVFDGVDTTAELFVNGLSAGTHNNALAEWTVDLLPYIKPGENQIAVCVHCGKAYVNESELEKYGGNSGSEDPSAPSVPFGWRSYLRKPQYTTPAMNMGSWYGRILYMPVFSMPTTGRNS